MSSGSSVNLPILFALSPLSQTLNHGITSGDPDVGHGFASEVQQLAQQFGQLAQQFGSQAQSSAGAWQGESGDAMRKVGGLLSQAGLDHADQVQKLGAAFEKVVKDVEQWSNLTNTTQTMADGVCKMLMALPFGAGVPAAHAYANATSAWTGTLAAMAVKTVKDGMDLLHSIDGKSFEQAWKPPAQSSFTPSFG